VRSFLLPLRSTAATYPSEFGVGCSRRPKDCHHGRREPRWRRRALRSRAFRHLPLSYEQIAQPLKPRSRRPVLAQNGRRPARRYPYLQSGLVRVEGTSRYSRLLPTEWRSYRSKAASPPCRDNSTPSSRPSTGHVPSATSHSRWRQSGFHHRIPPAPKWLGDHLAPSRKPSGRFEDGLTWPSNQTIHRAPSRVASNPRTRVAGRASPAIGSNAVNRTPSKRNRPAVVRSTNIRPAFGQARGRSSARHPSPSMPCGRTA
jgi:hypothetical protein